MIVSRPARGGFTLVELLVVIIVLIIIAAILLPAIGSMQIAGLRARSVSNLRQLHTATMNYASENNGRLPYSASHHWYDWSHVRSRIEITGTAVGWVHWNTNTLVTQWWDLPDQSNGLYSIRNGTLFPYVRAGATGIGDENVYVCPLMARLVRRVGAQTGANQFNHRYIVRRSYGMNDLIGTHGDHIRYYDIPAPARTFLFAQQGFVRRQGPNNWWYRTTLQDIRANQHWTDPDLSTANPPRRGRRRYARNLDGAIDVPTGNPTPRQQVEWTEHIGEYDDDRGVAVFVDGHVERVPFVSTFNIATGDWGD